MIRILLADDQTMIQKTLKLSLEPESDFQIVGSAEDGLTTLRQIEKLKPDIVLIDIEMPRINGLAATQIIHQRFSETKVLVLSSYDNEKYVKNALQSGAQGYLLKTTPAEELAKAIRCVHHGYVQLGPGLLEKVIKAEQVEALTVPESSPSNTLEVVAVPSALQPQEEWSRSTRELIDTLPRLWSRGLVYFLIIFATVILPWAMLAKVDETGQARGRLEPQGKTVRLDAPVGGTVKTIKVTEGQQVKAGQTLLELESEIVRTNLDQAQAKLDGFLNRLTQLELIESQLKISIRTQKLQSQAQKGEQLEQINQNKQQIEFNRQATQLAKQLLEKDEVTVQRYRKLRAEGVVSGLQVEEAERNLMQNQEKLQKNRLDIQQAESELKKQQSAYERIMRQGDLMVIDGEKQLKELQAQISDIQAEIGQTQNQIKSWQYQWQQRAIYAPIEGTIFQLPIGNAGAVVQSGQMIAQIAPKEAPLILRGQMDSGESGFLRPDMPVKVKFDAYPFQDYGVVTGRLKWISPDSKIVNQAEGQREVFELEIELDRNYIETSTQRITFTPGQTATAEVLIRQRRIIDFFLDPFKKLQKSGLNL